MAASASATSTATPIPLNGKHEDKEATVAVTMPPLSSSMLKERWSKRAIMKKLQSVTSFPHLETFQAQMKMMVPKTDEEKAQYELYLKCLTKRRLQLERAVEELEEELRSFLTNEHIFLNDHCFQFSLLGGSSKSIRVRGHMTR